MTAEILIVGAGPVGLNLALCLSNLGIKYRIIDKRSGLNVTSNAIGVNARTLEIWETLGFADEALKRGLALNVATWCDDGKPLGHASFSHVDSKYKIMLSLPQAHSEQLLFEQLTKFGINVEWDTTLIELTNSNNTAQVICKKNDITEEIEAKWVIGCDGYHSTVRNLAGIERGCHDLTQHFIMVDAQLNGILPLNEMTVSFHDDGLLFFLPMRNNVRIVADISKDPEYRQIKIGDAAIFNAILSKRFPGVSIKHIDWASAFYVHECLATQYYKNRVILCGDAAHTHSPAGGQGMNTGVQDTWNLAWKLTHILRNQASEKLLETYHMERHEVGQTVLNRSDKLTQVGSLNNKIMQAIRNFGISHLISLDKVAHKFTNSIAQTDIFYTDTSLVNTKQILHYGKARYQLEKIEWLLLVRNKLTNNHNLPNFIKIKEAPTSDLLKDLPLCLIRPDGYIALYATDISEIDNFLTINGFQIEDNN